MNEERTPAAAMFGLAGGMGSGKSTFGRLLAGLGAEVIDADEVMRDLRQPEQPGYVAIVDILGEAVIAADGSLDTEKISSAIFSNHELKREVEQATHPLVWGSMYEQVEALGEDDIAVLEVPLLKPENTAVFDGVIVVNTERKLAIPRLTVPKPEGRGFTPEEAEARISTQMTNEERAAMADRVVDNNGTYDDLVLAAHSIWQWMREVSEET